MSASLFDQLLSLCEAHVSSLVAALQGQTQDATAFLRKVLASWEQHCSQMVTIRSIFLVLDRKYVMETDARSLWYAAGVCLGCARSLASVLTSGVHQGYGTYFVLQAPQVSTHAIEQSRGRVAGSHLL